MTSRCGRGRQPAQVRTPPGEFARSSECGAAPDYRSIARFRERHLSALAQPILQALKLCQAAGMVSLGRVALDGTQVRPNAAKRKAWLASSRPSPAGAAYARRKGTVEPVFAQMSTLRNAKQSLLRGHAAARSEWLLLAACHDFRKLHGKIGVNGLGTLATA